MTSDQSRGLMDTPPNLKGRFPFSVGTTSFMYPADWITNVKRMGHLVDEIELLFFDSAYPGSLPDEQEVALLAEAAEDMNLRYHVHLPTDVFPGDPDGRRRQTAVDVLERVIRLLLPLKPVSHTLHLPLTATGNDEMSIHAWQARTRESLMSLLDRDIPPECISVENLDYPFAWAWEAVAPFGMNVCMDVGHLFMQGISPGDMFAEFREHIRVIHLHGVHGNRDHQAIDVLGEKEGGEILEILSGYTGSVSLEVFRRSDWEASARWMLANLESGRFTSLRKHSARG